VLLSNAVYGARSGASLGSQIVRVLRYARPYVPLIGLALVFTLLFAAGRYGRAYLMKPLFDEVLIPTAESSEPAAERPTALGDLLPSPALPDSRAPEASAAAEPDGTGRDASHPGSRWESFRRLLWAALVIVIIIPIGIFGRAYLSHFVLKRINVDIKQQLAGKLLRLPLSFHHQARSGDTMTRLLLDVDLSQKAFELIFLDFFLSTVMVAGGVTMFFVISWELAIVTLVAAPAIVGVLGYFAGRIQRTSRRRQEQVGEVTQRLMGILSGIKVIKAFRGEEVETRVFQRETLKYFRRAMKVVRTKIVSRSLVEMLNNGIAIGVLMLGAWLVLAGRLGVSVGDLAAFAGVLATTYKPIKTLSRGWTELIESLASAERFFQVLDRDEEHADAPDAVEIDGIHRGIRFDRVSFSYGREPVLREVSLDIPAGEVVALVGRSGAGKTTLVDLLLRFHDPDSGTIEIDGLDLRRIARKSLLDQVAVVTQEAFLFDATIGENIRYGRLEASESEFRAACRAAYVDEFVDQLPQGYDTEVGEFGVRLSGGQRQRITIARAILKNPAILAFDEATSALDAKTERTVQNAIDALRGRRTVFVIAHRLSTIRRADRILVLEDGVLSQQGTHEELSSGPRGSGSLRPRISG
jgi:subfamily B ATP-binding cassette protein MsbA